MNLLNFDDQWIARWAEFSGDRNPIHFDPKAAAKVGASDVVVHGMLPAVLCQERAYSSYIQETVDAQAVLAERWLLSKVRFKHPVLRRVSLELALRREERAVHFSLSSENTDSKHLLGSVSDHVGPINHGRSVIANSDLALPVMESFVLESLEVQSNTTKLRALFPTIESNWNVLQCILFMRFVDQIKRSGNILTTKHRDELLVVQTSSSVAFNARQTEQCGDALKTAYHCMAFPGSIFLTTAGYLCEYGWDLKRSGETIMSMQVGLLIKDKNFLEPNFSQHRSRI